MLGVERKRGDLGKSVHCEGMKKRDCGKCVPSIVRSTRSRSYVDTLAVRIFKTALAISQEIATKK